MRPRGSRSCTVQMTDIYICTTLSLTRASLSVGVARRGRVIGRSTGGDVRRLAVGGARRLAWSSRFSLRRCAPVCARAICAADVQAEPDHPMDATRERGRLVEREARIEDGRLVEQVGELLRSTAGARRAHARRWAHRPARREGPLPSRRGFRAAALYERAQWGSQSRGRAPARSGPPCPPRRAAGAPR